MILHVNALGALQRLFHRVKLLSDLEAFPLVLDHFDDGPQMAFGALETIDNVSVGGVNHILSMGIGYASPGAIQVRVCTHPSDRLSLKREAGAGSHSMNLAPARRW